MATRGVILMTELFPARELLSVVARIEGFGFDSIWLPELFGREPFATAGFLLARTERIAIGTGIANVYVRDATTIAQARQTLAELSSGRFLLGLGVSNEGLNKTRGHAWEPPLRKVTAVLDALDRIEVNAPAPVAKAPLLLAAHGPKLQALAAARCDGAITYLMPPAHTAATRARLGTAVELNVFAPFLFESDAKIARTKARSALRMYMGLDYYHREWQQLGFEARDFNDGGSDRLIDTLVAWGDANALRARLREYERAGASRVIVIPLALKTREGVDYRVLEAIAAPS